MIDQIIERDNFYKINFNKSVGKAVDKVKSQSIKHLLVYDDEENLLGLLTNQDLFGVNNNRILADCRIEKISIITEIKDIKDCLKFFSKSNQKYLLFVDTNDNPISVITKNSIIIHLFEQYEKTKEQLVHSEKLSAVGQLTAGIAHEFNNLLAIIYNNTQLIEIDQYKSNPNLIKTIEKAALRGAGIVSNMMSFAKPLTPKKEMIKIENIIEEVLNLQKQQLILEHIEIDKNYETTEKVFIDKGQFQQVFLNLIINARHAIQPKEKGKILISSKTINKNLEIKITDNGIGIEPENLKNIFNPFFSTKGAWAGNNYGIKGTGLGLSVTHSIIKNHNGTIQAESEKDKGATFIIELPISEEQTGNITQEPEKKVEEKIESKVLNVLIVDDENSIITSMTRLFRINNCEVKNSVSGLEGLKIAKENKFDVIFLDMLLPDISGENIFKEIRQFDKDVPIVFISGQIGLEVEKLKELGAYAFIQKPFSMDDVKKILTEIRQNK